MILRNKTAIVEQDKFLKKLQTCFEKEAHNSHSIIKLDCILMHNLEYDLYHNIYDQGFYNSRISVCDLDGFDS